MKKKTDVPKNAKTITFRPAEDNEFELRKMLSKMGETPPRGLISWAINQALRDFFGGGGAKMLGT